MLTSCNIPSLPVQQGSFLVTYQVFQSCKAHFLYHTESSRPATLTSWNMPSLLVLQGSLLVTCWVFQSSSAHFLSLVSSRWLPTSWIFRKMVPSSVPSTRYGEFSSISLSISRNLSTDRVWLSLVKTMDQLWVKAAYFKSFCLPISTKVTSTFIGSRSGRRRISFSVMSLFWRPM